jgi:hypothetical protein
MELLTGPASMGVLNFFTGAKRRQANLGLEQIRAINQQQLAKHQHLLRLEELKEQSENSKELERYRSELRHVELNYPMKGGPGKLREDLEVSYGPGCPDMPPLVLIMPAIDETSQGTWNNVRFQAEALLAPFVNRRLIHLHPGVPHRWFNWPNAQFYLGDLINIPTIVVQLMAGVEALNVWLGGCHLIPDEPLPRLPADPRLEPPVSACEPMEGGGRRGPVPDSSHGGRH